MRVEELFHDQRSRVIVACRHVRQAPKARLPLRAGSRLSMYRPCLSGRGHFATLAPRPRMGCRQQKRVLTKRGVGDKMG